MKTVSEIEKEINDILRSLNKDSGKQERDRAKRDITFLKQIKLYLESNPRPEFIQSEIDVIQNRIANIDKGFEAWKVGRNLSKYKDVKSAYLNEMKLSDLRNTLKTLKYLL